MLCFEDFTPGRRFALGPRLVERDEVLRFAREFDPQPFHLDETAALASLLEGLSASGWHSSALMMRMMCEGFLLGSTSQGSPGVDELRWLHPVRPGDTLSGEAEVIEVRPSASRPTLGIARLRNTLRNAAGRDVLVCVYAVLLLRREVAA